VFAAAHCCGKTPANFSFVSVQTNTALAAIGVRGGGWWRCRPPGMKNFRENSVFRESATCSKILNDEKYFNTVKNFGTTLFFRASLKLLKNPECERYVQYRGKFQGKICFSGQAQVAQKS